MDANFKQTKNAIQLIVYASFIIMFVSCNDDPAYLHVSDLNFKEVLRNKTLSQPNGGFRPDNPNFDINNADLWTGNMAQYVKQIYVYSVSCAVINNGDFMAYDAEIDVYYEYDNGEEQLKTFFLGNIEPGQIVVVPAGITTENKQLIGVTWDVFWFD